MNLLMLTMKTINQQIVVTPTSSRNAFCVLYKIQDRFVIAKNQTKDTKLTHSRQSVCHIDHIDILHKI